VPLGSLDGNGRNKLRPDKLAVVVTDIQSQRDVGNSWPEPSSPSSSEDRLTTDKATAGKIEVGVHRTFELTTTADTTSSTDDGEGSHRMAKEHI
jgi:hypothetical protein